MAENNDKKAVTLSQLERVTDALISKVEQFAIPDSSIEVDHLSENVIELINQNSFILEDKSIEAKHLSEEIVNLLNKDCSISEEDYNSFVSFDVNELVFSNIRKSLYTVTYDATENCVAHFTVVCDMSRIANYKTINLNMKVFNWSGPDRQQTSGGGTFSSNVLDLDGSYVHVGSYQGTSVINGDIVNGEGTLTGSIAPIMSADALSKPYIKLAFAFTNLKVGQPVSFDINDISLTIDGAPLEILNFGGFFPKEGCTVVSHIEEPDEPGVLEEHMIAKYTFNSATDSNLLPTFGGVKNYTIKDEKVGNTITRTIMSSDDFTSCKFQAKTALLSVEYLNVTNKATVLNHLFSTCSNLTSVNVSGWDTSNVTAMNDMFCQCSSLVSIEGLDTWDTGNVTNMQGMFAKCSKLQTLDLSSFDTKNLTNVNYLFEACPVLKDLNVSTWDVSKIGEFTWTFYNCPSLIELDLSGWNMKDTVTTSSTFLNDRSLIKIICKQHTLFRIQGAIPARSANSWGTIICEDLESNYDISILQGKYWNVEGPSVEPDEPEQPDESSVFYHVEYTPTEKLNDNDAAHFTVVMNRSDYTIGSTIHFNMNINNWSGPERTAMEVGGGIFVANSSALDGSFNGGSATTHLLLSGNLINGNGVLEQTFAAPNIVQDGSFVKLAFSFTKVEMGQTISFDINSISLKVDDKPVEILNFGGFFPGEGCTVVKVN